MKKQNIFQIALLAVALFMSMAAMAQSKIYYVSPTQQGTGDGSSWANAINGNAWYGFDDGLPHDEIDYDHDDPTDFITGLQYAVNEAYKASLIKDSSGDIAYKT